MRESDHLLVIERERAKERQGTRNDIVATLPQCDQAKSRDIVADKVGMSGRTSTPYDDYIKTQSTFYWLHLKYLKQKRKISVPMMSWGINDENNHHNDATNINQIDIPKFSILFLLLKDDQSKIYKE